MVLDTVSQNPSQFSDIERSRYLSVVSSIFLAREFQFFSSEVSMWLHSHFIILSYLENLRLFLGFKNTIRTNLRIVSHRTMKLKKNIGYSKITCLQFRKENGQRLLYISDMPCYINTIRKSLSRTFSTILYSSFDEQVLDYLFIL